MSHNKLTVFTIHACQFIQDAEGLKNRDTRHRSLHFASSIFTRTVIGVSCL